MWIGANSCILAVVHVNDGAVIGGGSVVTKDVPYYAIVAGNPAKVIGHRFSENVIDRLREIQWWEWPEAVIRENISLFRSDMNEETLQQLERIADRNRQDSYNPLFLDAATAEAVKFTV